MTPRPAVLIAIVSVLVLIAPFSNDIFLPSMPSMARELATAHWFNISAAKRDFGYQPKVSMEEGLRRLRETVGSP